MAQIIIEIKDGYEIAIAKGLGFSYAPDKVPPLQEHVDAIQAKLYSIIEPLYEKAVYEDPEVAAKKAEYEAIYQQKLDAIKSTGK